MNCLIIFAKEPDEDTVKTRLKGYLTDFERVELYKRFLRDTVALAEKLDCEEKMLAFDAKEDPVYLKKTVRDFTLYRQKGKDLGEKIIDAFRFAVEKGAGKVVVIGSDSPDLPLEYIEEAFKRLDEVDIVLGPSHDGGYYLIGMKKLCPGLFNGVKWSSESVLSDTLDNAVRLRRIVHLLSEWHDIDTPGDLRRFGEMRP